MQSILLLYKTLIFIIFFSWRNITWHSSFFDIDAKAVRWKMLSQNSAVLTKISIVKTNFNLKHKKGSRPRKLSRYHFSVYSADMTLHGCILPNRSLYHFCVWRQYHLTWFNITIYRPTMRSIIAYFLQCMII